MSVPDPLRFEVAPDIVEHLGLNLYTNLPRVLVEFIANAYDADSGYADISIDFNQVKDARRHMREVWRAKHEKKAPSSDEIPLEEMTLPQEIHISIEDRGHGMSRDDLQQKFLRIARKRRDEDKGRSPSGRVVMGRKGIGKLAGFGIAHCVEVTSRTKAEGHATKIVLDYDKLIGLKKTENVQIPDFRIEGGGGLNPSGTRIVLSRLLYEPTGSKIETIAQEIGEYFNIIKSSEFEVRINGTSIPPSERVYAFGYPNPDLPIDQLVHQKLPIDEQREVSFSYRIRFTGKGHQLKAGQRGMRVYAHQRLASLPDLLDLGTGMHGFQNTHYLDGIVQADFIDKQRSDYISSNRHSLRWDTPLLAPMRKFLTDEMSKACSSYQGTKDKTVAKQVKDDPFTKELIEKASLPASRRKMAFHLATKLAANCGDETDDQYYKDTLPPIIHSLGYGELISAIADLAQDDHPSFPSLVGTIAKLTSAELADFSRIVGGRIKGIGALRKIFKESDFKKPNNEDELHSLLKGNPWLVDATFWQFLTSNETEDTLSEKLMKALKVGPFVVSSYDKTKPEESEPFGKNRRPDLVFLLSNSALARVVIVELKAPNTPLHGEHLLQLKRYRDDVLSHLKTYGQGHLRVEGFLIGSRAPKGSREEGVQDLKVMEDEIGPNSEVRVFDLFELLKRAEDAHKELLDIYERSAKRLQEEEVEEE
jgi:hypothetical protein